MRIPLLSDFWRRCWAPDWLSNPIWCERDREWEAHARQAHEAEALDMGAWLKLADAERSAIVAGYARPRRPQLAPAAAAE